MGSFVEFEIVEENKIKESLANLLDKIDGLKEQISRGDTVFIKPNMFINAEPESGLNTHPELIIAVAKYFNQLGAKVVVGERNGQIENNFIKFPEIYKYARLVDLDHEEVVLKQPLADNYVINFPLPLPMVIDRADFIINMPGLRTHVLTKISNALKNLMGFLPGCTTRLIHLSGLDEAIVDLNKMINVDLIISDAIFSLEGSFPANNGQPLETNFIMAADDPVAIDSVAASIIGYSPQEVDTIRLAEQAGLGKIIKEVVIPEGLSSYKFVKPKPAREIEEYSDKLNIYYQNACDKCSRALVNGIFSFFEENQKLDPDILKEINIITGGGYPIKLNNCDNLIYGNCARIYKESGLYEPGCPPLTGAVKKRLADLYSKLEEK